MKTRVVPKEWGEGDYKTAHAAFIKVFRENNQEDLIGKISLMTAEFGADEAFKFVKPYAQAMQLPNEVIDMLLLVHRHIEYLQNKP